MVVVDVLVLAETGGGGDGEGRGGGGGGGGCGSAHLSSSSLDESPLSSFLLLWRFLAGALGGGEYETPES